MVRCGLLGFYFLWSVIDERHKRLHSFKNQEKSGRVLLELQKIELARVYSCELWTPCNCIVSTEK